MTHGLLTATEIAKRLTIPESTIRYYRDRFPAYVPMTGEGRSRRFRPEAIDVLRFIADQLRSGVPASNVESELSQRFPITVVPQQENATAQLPQVSTAATQQQSMEALHSLFADVVRSALAADHDDLRAEIAALREHITSTTAAAAQQQSEEISRLRGELAAARDQLATFTTPPPKPRAWWQIWR